MSIENVLNPSSIAIVGSTERKGSFGYSCTHFALKSEVKEIYLVNPTKTELFGRKAYPTLADLPIVPECVAICVPYSKVNDILTQCGELGIHGAVVYASGYSEIPTPDGAERERKMCDICEKYQISVLGPNCGGFINKTNRKYLWGLWMNENKMEREGGGLSIISQSGGVVANFFNSTFTDISYALSIGNSCVISPEEYMNYLIDDESTKVIALYLEGCRRPKAFCEALKKAAELGKPVVILKGGRSPKGVISAKAHSGSFAGDWDAFSAVAERYGVIIADSDDELITTCTALLTLSGMKTKGLNTTSVNLSGAQTTQFADTCAALDLNIPDFDEKTRRLLAERLPDFATVKSPLDATTELFKDLQRCSELLRFSATSKDVDFLCFTASNLSPVEGHDDNAMTAMSYARRDGYAAPIFVVPNYEMTRDYEKWLRYRSMQVAVMSPGTTGYLEIRRIAEFMAYCPDEHELNTAAFEMNKTEPYETVEGSADEILKAAGIDRGDVKDGTEIYLGIERDSQFGPVVKVRLGGKYGIFDSSVSTGLCPMKGQEAKALLSKLDIHELVEENATLAEAIVKLSVFAAEKESVIANASFELKCGESKIFAEKAEVNYIK